jgi:hypothetical protein
MAAGIRGVDLQAVSAHTGIPHGTLRRWASIERWTIVSRDPLEPRRKLYDWRQVAQAVTARQQREAA